MTDLFEYLRENGDTGWGYSVDEAVYGAKEAGVVKTVEYVSETALRERRWGVNTVYVYKLDDKLIGIEVYVMHSETGEDLFEGIYEVEPYEFTETRYRRKSG